MSNPEKAINETTEEEIIESSDGSEYTWSDDEINELVLALPALKVSETPNEEEADREQAVVAAQLLMAAAEEARTVTKGKGQESGTSGDATKTKKVGRPKKITLGDLADAIGASGSGEGVKPRKKGSNILTNPPPGPPKCNVCGKEFGSWKAVFGHLRLHKDRGYVGFLPPPRFNPAEEDFGGHVAASSSRRGLGYGTGGLEVDLNADPVEQEEEQGAPKFDLNRSPPQEDEGDQEKEGDKA